MNVPYDAGRPAPLHLLPYRTAQRHENMESHWFSSVGMGMKAETLAMHLGLLHSQWWASKYQMKTESYLPARPSRLSNVGLLPAQLSSKGQVWKLNWNVTGILLGIFNQSEGPLIN